MISVNWLKRMAVLGVVLCVFGGFNVGLRLTAIVALILMAYHFTYFSLKELEYYFTEKMAIDKKEISLQIAISIISLFFLYHLMGIYGKGTLIGFAGLIAITYLSQIFLDRFD